MAWIVVINTSCPNAHVDMPLSLRIMKDSTPYRPPRNAANFIQIKGMTA